MRLGIAGAALVLALAPASFAHRLDEYLQATLVSISKDRVDVYVRLVPGVAVAPRVLASIDQNGDGVVSEAEARAYAENVLRDVSLRANGRPLAPRFTSIRFPPLEEIREGMGQIELEFRALLPGPAAEGRLIVENRHPREISVYLMNCLAPPEDGVRIVRQNRNRNQSWYEVEYGTGTAGGARSTLGAGFASVFQMGMRHIAEGTDHLLFLLTLLLPAPLVAASGRWAGTTGVGTALARIARVVSAFTIGHSLTLALAGFGLVQAPARPIEVAIAFSIALSAAHAARPIFPGREAAIACFFGLVHGLAFASTIAGLGLSAWQRVISVLAFNLGIETMQLAVVGAVLPSLLLLSRGAAYTSFRLGGAAFSGLAAAGWVVERWWNVHAPVDRVMNSLARQAIWVATGLLAVSFVASRVRRARIPRQAD